MNDYGIVEKHGKIRPDRITDEVIAELSDWSKTFDQDVLEVQVYDNQEGDSEKSTYMEESVWHPMDLRVKPDHGKAIITAMIDHLKSKMDS